MSTIPILVDDSDDIDMPEPIRKRGFSVPVEGEGSSEHWPRRKSNVKEVKTSKIKSALSKLTGEISGMLQDVKSVGDFRLRQVAITVEINAEGKVFLVGKAGAKGGVTLTFEA